MKPYPTIDVVYEDPNPILPINYYDNDDGFWDDYIKMKQRKLEEHNLITNRKFFKH